MSSAAFSRWPVAMAFPIATRAFVVPLSALSTTIFGSLSAVISWATWRILSGLPTEVPPNFMILNWVMLLFWVCKDREFHVQFDCERFEIINDGRIEGDPCCEPLRLHFTFGVPRDQNFVVAGRGRGAAETADPFVHMHFEFIRRAEGIDSHSAEEVTDPFAGHVGRHGNVSREWRNPRSVVGAA